MWEMREGDLKGYGCQRQTSAPDEGCRTVSCVHSQGDDAKCHGHGG